jgi:hypothetical protein
MGLHAWTDTGADPFQAYPAVEVVGDGGDDEGHDERAEEPVHEEGEERQFEDVEADIPVEERVLQPERARVPEEDPVVPAGHGRQSEGHSQEKRNRSPHRPRPAGEKRLEFAQRISMWGGRAYGGRDALCDQEVRQQEHQADGREDEAEAELGE